MMEHLSSGMAERWKDLGHPALPRSNTDNLVEQVEAVHGRRTGLPRRSRRRDHKQLALNHRARRDERTRRR